MPGVLMQHCLALCMPNEASFLGLQTKSSALKWFHDRQASRQRCELVWPLMGFH